jgi:phosphoglycerate dehydrogenase-like enzyme
VKWAHFSMAGLSSIQHSEFWESSIDVTTSRGYAGARAIAEMAVFGAMMIAKGFQTAVRQTDAKASDGKVFAPKLAQGKTIGVIGLGGIGMNVATIAHGLGLKVLGSRRSATKRGPGKDGIIDEVFPPADLHTLLGESDIVVLATPATAETEHMINATAFEAMKPGAIFVNISRGENTDEHALASTIASGHLAGAYLDVFTGSEEGEQPPVELSSLPNVVITPHIASRADTPMPNTMDLFCSNLRRFLDGQPLENIVDWQRGY